MSIAHTMFEGLGPAVVAEGPGGHVLLYTTVICSTKARPPPSAGWRRAEDACAALISPSRRRIADSHLAGVARASIPRGARMVESLARYTADQHVHFGVGDVPPGIVHVIGPEQG